MEACADDIDRASPRPVTEMPIANTSREWLDDQLTGAAERLAREERDPRDLLEALACHLLLLRRQRRSRYCLTGYRQFVGLFLRFLAARGLAPSLDTLTPSLVYACLDWSRSAESPLWRAARPRGRQDGAAADAAFVRYVKQFARVLCEQGLYDEDPLRRVKPVRAPKPHREPYTESELLRLVAATSTSATSARDRALVLLLMDLGCRIGELCQANVGDVDMEHGSITFRRTKNGHSRQVRFGVDLVGGGPCMVALRVWLKQRPTDPTAPLFTDVRGQRRLTPRAAENLIARLGQVAGIEGAIPHRFRHTNATEYLKEQPGAEIQLRSRLGHVSPHILADYVHITQSMSADGARVASISSRLLSASARPSVSRETPSIPSSEPVGDPPVLAVPDASEEQRHEPDVAALSKRQLEVLALLPLGLANRQIASRLGISTDTVKNHLSAASAKLGVHGRLAIAMKASELANAAARLSTPVVGAAPGAQNPAARSLARVVELRTQLETAQARVAELERLVNELRGVDAGGGTVAPHRQSNRDQMGRRRRALIADARP